MRMIKIHANARNQPRRFFGAGGVTFVSAIKNPLSFVYAIEQPTQKALVSSRRAATAYSQVSISQKRCLGNGVWNGETRRISTAPPCTESHGGHRSAAVRLQKR